MCEANQLPPGVLTDSYYNSANVYKNKGSWKAGNGIPKETLLIDPFNEESVTPVGYDLRIGKRYIKLNYDGNSLPQSVHLEVLNKSEELEIKPGEFLAVETEEYIGMPKSKKLSGILVSKVSLANLGISQVSASIDPDWEGELLVTLVNLNKIPIILKRGQPFCTMILFTNSKPANLSSQKNPGNHKTYLVRTLQKAIEDNRIIYRPVIE